MRKKFLILSMAMALSVSLLAGCANADQGAKGTAAAPGESFTLKEGGNKVSDRKQAVLVVSFGTSYNDSRDITIGAIEKTISEAFPEYEVRRAFTSQIIIDKLKKRDGLEIDNVKEALERAMADGIERLVVQPTHLMNGYEYTDLEEELNEYQDKFSQIALAKPLLSSEEDFRAVAKAIASDMASYEDGETAVCFMGHGTEADSNSVYQRMQEVLIAEGYENFYIGTVEAEPGVEDVLKALNKAGKYKKVVLKPLMVVAGDHANNDMAGDEEDSWKSIFTNAGFEVKCVLEGLGQSEAIQDIYAAHTKAAVESLEN